MVLSHAQWIPLNLTYKLSRNKHWTFKSSLPSRGEISHLDPKMAAKKWRWLFVNVPSSTDFSTLSAPMVVGNLYNESEETMKTSKPPVDASRSTWSNRKYFVIASHPHILGSLICAVQLKSWGPWGACSYINILQQST